MTDKARRSIERYITREIEATRENADFFARESTRQYSANAEKHEAAHRELIRQFEEALGEFQTAFSKP